MTNEGLQFAPLVEKEENILSQYNREILNDFVVMAFLFVLIVIFVEIENSVLTNIFATLSAFQLVKLFISIKKFEFREAELKTAQDILQSVNTSGRTKHILD